MYMNTVLTNTSLVKVQSTITPFSTPLLSVIIDIIDYVVYNIYAVMHSLYSIIYVL